MHKVLSAIFLFMLVATSRAAGNFGDWTPVIRTDRMTDARVCTLTNRRNPRLVYDTSDNLTLLVRAEGGAKGYRFRLDQDPPIEWDIRPTAASADWVVVPSWRAHLANGSRLLLQWTDRVDRIHEADIDLKGLKAARAKMLHDCGMSEEFFDERPYQPEPNR
jgi:hypothetical protein